MKIPVLRVVGDSHADLEAAFDAAVRNLTQINTVPCDLAVYNKTGLLPEGGCMIRAGQAYEKPWTRDCAVNCWNAASLLIPQVARNTLWAVCERTEQGRLVVQCDSQWWDKVIWVRGAWEHYSITADRGFLSLAREAAAETIRRMEQERFCTEYGLFKGPAMMADGIAGYPVPPATPDGICDSVLGYPDALEIMCLSTNCIYVDAYRCLAAMADEVGGDSVLWRHKADALSRSINRHLWRDEASTYGYFIHGSGPLAGRLDRHQEGIGLAFAVLDGVADRNQTARIMKTVHVQPKGITAVWPHFDGFSDEHPGRHNVMCWPIIGGFWAEAAMRGGRPDLFYRELTTLAGSAVEHDGEFFELYDSRTGAIDGGFQPVGPHGVHYESCHHQTWSATAFLRMVFRVLLGMHFAAGQLRLQPVLPPEITRVELRGLPWQNRRLQIIVSDGGRTVQQIEEC